MTMSRRPLNGAPALGVPLSLPVGLPVAVLHTLDGTAASLGGPYPQVITIVISNSTAAPIEVVLAFAGQPALARTLAAGETAEIISQQPMLPSGPAAPNNQILAAADAPGAFAWGWFGTQS